MSERERDESMTKIDALLDNPGRKGKPAVVPLPEPADRKRLRMAFKLTQQQVAEAVGVTPGNVGGWESGRWEPAGKNREDYAYLLRGIAERLGESTDWEGTDDDH